MKLSPCHHNVNPAPRSKSRACPYLLFVWPLQGTNPGWSFIWGQSLCLQWHNKCHVQGQQWLMNPAGVGHSGQQKTQRRGPKLPVSWKVFRRGPTPWPNTPSAPKPSGSRHQEGSSGCFQGRGYNTKCLYEALWLLETVGDGTLLLQGRKTLCFYWLPGMCWGLWTSALLAYVIQPPAMKLLVVW